MLLFQHHQGFAVHQALGALGALGASRSLLQAWWSLMPSFFRVCMYLGPNDPTKRRLNLGRGTQQGAAKYKTYGKMVPRNKWSVLFFFGYGKMMISHFGFEVQVPQSQTRLKPSWPAALRARFASPPEMTRFGPS